ncbi:hypothetical protein HZ994_04225 [Akkermansiaceae bacterium]|nr:hypothetical protein HZ994_04225 [Akkermansiaceae bacterium]
MIQRVISSYPMRFAFVVGALATALLIVHYRLLLKRDTSLFRANRHRTGG